MLIWPAMKGPGLPAEPHGDAAEMSDPRDILTV
jgi:hypothetical protein